MKTLSRILLLHICLVVTISLSAQDTPPLTSPTTSQTPHTGVVITARRDVRLFEGPGETYLLLAWMQQDSTAALLERNHTGTWLHVQTSDGRFQGWAMSGYFALPPELRFSEIPINRQPDADLNRVLDPALRRLYAVPVIPTLSQAMIDLFTEGQAQGNRRRSITKIGDSLSASRLYLEPMARSDNDLGPYDYLRESLEFYGPFAGRTSVAAQVGLNSVAVFDPAWATPGRCETGETPLACEYRRKRPSIALIAFGPNDMKLLGLDRYTQQMRRILDETLAQHIIPVLTTFSCDPEHAFWQQCLYFNRALTDLAAEYEAPIINFWAASRPLPGYGLDVDQLHLAQTGFEYLRYSTGHESWYGAALQNLLALRTLDEIRRAVSVQAN